LGRNLRPGASPPFTARRNARDLKASDIDKRKLAKRCKQPPAFALAAMSRTPDA